MDTTPPIAGIVLDGKDHHKDLIYHSSKDRICAAWKDFYDPESGIGKITLLVLKYFCYLLDML